MGRDPQINEKDIFWPENFIARPPRRIMTFPETRVDLNRLIKKIKPELGSESFQNYKNTFSASYLKGDHGHHGMEPPN